MAKSSKPLSHPFLFLLVLLAHSAMMLLVACSFGIRPRC